MSLKLPVVFFLGWLLLAGPLCRAQKFAVDSVQKSGPLNRRINVVILGDGYTAAELPRFDQDARSFIAFFTGYVPYNAYKGYFNFFTIPIASKESGATNPGTAADRDPNQPVETKDTYFGATFGTNGINRLVTIKNYQAFTNVMATNLPTYDMAVIIVNSPWYGGSGGGLSVFTRHELANQIAVHEIGHTFSLLKDEYWPGIQFVSEAANMTRIASPASVVWKNWLNQANVSIFPHSGATDAAGWYKPTTQNCLMERLDRSFCAVCREATTNKILKLINPVDRILPLPDAQVIIKSTPERFQLTLLKPNPNTLRVEWRLNDVLLNRDSAQVSITNSQLPARLSQLSVSVFDSTTYIRLESHRQQHVYTYRWTLEKADLTPPFSVSSGKGGYCAGESFVLTAQNCTGTLLWSTGATTASISVSATQPTTYSALCTAPTGLQQTAAVGVSIYPRPAAQATNTGPVIEGQPLQLMAGGGGSYAWTGPASFTDTVQNPAIPAVRLGQAGTYTVVVTSADGCVSTAQTTVRVDLLLAVSPRPSDTVEVFPNPAGSRVTVQTELPGDLELMLFDGAGRVVLKKAFRQSVELVTAPLPRGLYAYRISNGQRVISGKLLLE